MNEPLMPAFHTLKRGDTRADGYRFVNYQKRGGKFREKWASPEAFAKDTAYQVAYHKKRRALLKKSKTITSKAF